MKPLFVFLDVDTNGVDSSRVKNDLNNKSFKDYFEVVTELIRLGYDDENCRVLTPNQLVEEINGNGIFENEFCCLVNIE
jgi:predicted anti-sigma-YlaC factor YlaD